MSTTDDRTTEGSRPTKKRKPAGASIENAREQLAAFEAWISEPPRPRVQKYDYKLEPASLRKRVSVRTRSLKKPGRKVAPRGDVK